MTTPSISPGKVKIFLPVTQKLWQDFFIRTGTVQNENEFHLDFQTWQPSEREQWLKTAGMPQKKQEGQFFYNFCQYTNFLPSLIPQTNNEWIQVAQEYREFVNNQPQRENIFGSIGEIKPFEDIDT